MANHYETVFILNPVLSEQQTKDTVEKFRKILTDLGSEIENENDWGLRKLAYPIQKKTNGYYYIIEFAAEASVVAKLETEYRREEHVMRFLTIRHDKHGIDYNQRKRKGLIGKKAEA
jgi:small subunit ribosomal protein S6